MSIYLLIIWKFNSISELCSEHIKNFMKKNSITWESCVSHSQNQNDMSKRNIEIISQRTKATIIQTCLSKKLWAEVMMLIVFLINISSIFIILYQMSSTSKKSSSLTRSDTITLTTFRKRSRSLSHMYSYTKRVQSSRQLTSLNHKLKNFD